jgi:hypothetical protein
MKRRLLKSIQFFTLAGLLLLGACNFWIAGHSNDFGMILSGEGVANPADGTTAFTMRADGVEGSCKGSSKPLEKGDGRRWASIEISCTDGRTAKGESVLGGMEWGTGTGIDSCGNEFETYFNIHQYYVTQKLEEFRRMAKNHSGGFDRCQASGDAPPHRDPLS